MESNVTSILRVSFISFSLLLYQIFLTRIFSVIIWYHLAFLAISLSMFGLCLGAFATFLFDRFYSAENYLKNQLSHGFLMGIFMIASVFFLSYIGQKYSDPLSILWIALLLYFLCAIPFYFGGCMISLLIKNYKGDLGKLYAFDLFAAALACYAVILVLKFVSVPTAIVALGVAIIFFSFLIQNNYPRWNLLRFKMGALAVVVVFGLLLNSLAANSPYWFEIRSAKTLDPSEPLFEKWNSFSRIQVSNYFLKPFGWGLTQKTPDFQSIKQYQLTIDGVAGTVFTHFNGDLSKLTYLKYDSINLAHYLKRGADVFVVGVGGGRDVLSSLVFNQKSVVGAEINETILNTLNQQFGRFTGHLDQISNVTFVNDEARSYLTRTEKKFDLIIMSLIDTFAATSAGAFSLSENSIYTTEAFELFLQKLNAGGVVSVSRWWADSSPHEAYKLIKLVSDTLRISGVTDPVNHMYFVRTQGRFGEVASDTNVSTLLFSKQPFSARDISELDKVVNELDLKLILSPTYLPGGAINEIIAGHEVSAPEFANFNLKAPTDDSPFFFQFMKINTFNPFKVEDTFLKNFIYLLWIGVVFLITIIICSFLFNPSWNSKQFNFPALTIYFTLIGLGFLLIELSQMQRLGIFLGHPIYSLTTTLFTFLACSGIGSFFSTQVQQLIARKNTLMAFGLFLIVLFLSGVLTNKIISLSSALDLGYRIAIAFFLLAPSAFFMGVMLPVGLSFVPSTDSNSKAWLWGINGAGSVVASILSSVLSIYSGISVAYWAGFIFYFFAVLIFLIFIRKSNQKLSMRSRKYSLRNIALFGILIFCGFFYFLKSQSFSNKKLEIKVYHWMDNRKIAFQKLSEKFYKEKGIEIKFEHSGNIDSYHAAILQGKAEEIRYDLFGILGDIYTISTFIKENLIEDLKSLYQSEKWVERFDPLAIEELEFRKGNRYKVTPGIYGFPLDMNAFMFVFNKRLFSKFGLDPERPPQNWSELVAINQKVESLGGEALVLKFSSKYLLKMFIMNFVLSNFSKQEVADTFAGKISYSSPRWLKLFQSIEELKPIKKHGNYMATNESSEQKFFNEKTLIMFNGSWIVSDLDQFRPNLEYGVFLMPPIDSKSGMFLLKTPGSIFYLNQNSLAKEQTIDFLKWISLEENASEFAKNSFSISAVKSAQKFMNPKMSTLFDSATISMDPTNLFETENSYILEMMMDGVTKIINNEMTAEQLVEVLEKAQVAKRD